MRSSSRFLKVNLNAFCTRGVSGYSQARSGSGATFKPSSLLCRYMLLGVVPAMFLSAYLFKQSDDEDKSFTHSGLTASAAANSNSSNLKKHTNESPIVSALSMASSSSSVNTSAATSTSLQTLQPIHLLLRTMECAPTYNGIPVAATLLMHQTFPHFTKQFPGLEMSAVFVGANRDPNSAWTRPQETVQTTNSSPNGPSKEEINARVARTKSEQELNQFAEGYAYSEAGVLKGVGWPTRAEAEVPIFEKLDKLEESKLAAVGINKRSVGRLIMVGECSYGCAKVRLTEIKVYSLEGVLIWEKKV